MASLTVGGVNIPVAISSPSWTRIDNVDRADAFDGTFRASQSGGARRDWDFQTPPVTIALGETYKAALASPASKLCSGDILQLPTMCSPELMGGTPMRASGGQYVVLNFKLHEVQPVKVLLRYSPGDTITGESFSRSTAAGFTNSAGVLGSAAINVKRDSHYTSIGGTRGVLLEGARTNLVDADFSGWTATTVTVTTGQADPAGGTAASLLSTTAANGNVKRTTPFTADATKGASVRFKAGTAAQSNVGIFDSTAAAWRHLVLVTWTAGVPSLSTLTGSGTLFPIVALTSGWYEIEFSAVGVVAANTNQVLISPAHSGSGTVYAFRPQAENAILPSSSINGFSTARGADSYSLPFAYPPSEMTVYVKFVERGSLLDSKYVFALATATGADPRLAVFSSASFYSAYHHNGTAGVQADLAATPAFGDTVELVVRLFGDGSIDLLQSINAATATAATQSAALALATAWATTPVVTLNNSGTGGSPGFTALQSFKICSGARSLAEARAL